MRARDILKEAADPAALKKQIAELEHRADAARAALNKARAVTKEIKYQNVAIDIVSRIKLIADEIGINEKEFNYEANAVYEAERALESAVYNLEDIFSETLRDLEYKIDDLETELKYPEEAFTNEGKKMVVKSPKPRDPNYATLVAKRTSGSSGAHADKTKIIPRKEKHKSQPTAEMNMPFAGDKVGQKTGKAGQWRNDGASKNRPAKKGDLVGGGA